MRLKKLFCVFVTALLVYLPLSTFAEEIVIYHTNDIHARILDSDDKNQSIGFAYVSAYVKNARAQNKNTLWLDAGDTFHGLPIVNVSKGENMALLLNAAGVDALSPGNHDFNYSAERLEELSKECKFPFLAANIFWKKNGQRLFDAYKIFTLENGLKIGVFGLTTPDTAKGMSPQYVDKLLFLDTVEKTKEVVKVLKPECDIIIGLTHLGVNDNASIKSTDIANAVAGIDVIIDGHSHTELPQGIIAGNTLIAQTGCWDHNLGKVTINVENKNIIDKKAVLIRKDEIVPKNEKPKNTKDSAAKEDNSLKPDEDIVAVLKDIETKNAKILGEVVAVSSKTLPCDQVTLRREETELGDFVADALLWKTNADAAIYNGATIRADLKQGNVTKGDILAMFPFGNILQTAKVSGKDVKAALEHSVEHYPVPFGGFLQVAGMTFEFDPALEKGARVSNIIIKGEPLMENKIYLIASSDFIFNGGNEYFMLKGKKIDREYGDMGDVLAEYLTDIKNFETTKGRIKCLKEMPVPNMESAADKKAKQASPAPKKEPNKESVVKPETKPAAKEPDTVKIPVRNETQKAA